MHDVHHRSSVVARRRHVARGLRGGGRGGLKGSPAPAQVPTACDRWMPVHPRSRGESDLPARRGGAPALQRFEIAQLLLRQLSVRAGPCRPDTGIAPTRGWPCPCRHGFGLAAALRTAVLRATRIVHWAPPPVQRIDEHRYVDKNIDRRQYDEVKLIQTIDAECCPQLLAEPLDGQDADRLAAALRVLADPARLRLLSIIGAHPNGEACVCDLTAPIGLSQPTVSHHLKVLADAGLVGREKRGRLGVLLGPAGTAGASTRGARRPRW